MAGDSHGGVVAFDKDVLLEADGYPVQGPPVFWWEAVQLPRLGQGFLDELGDCVDVPVDLDSSRDEGLHDLDRSQPSHPQPQHQFLEV